MTETPFQRLYRALLAATVLALALPLLLAWGAAAGAWMILVAVGLGGRNVA
ncbi:MAG: hypothetical protein PHX05_00100 [Acidobacteriota bacterium]|nr:hypothetical protein [Acidobacteriota bacterium]